MGTRWTRRASVLGLPGTADTSAAETDVGNTEPNPVGRIIRRVR